MTWNTYKIYSEENFFDEITILNDLWVDAIKI